MAGSGGSLLWRPEGTGPAPILALQPACPRRPARFPQARISSSPQEHSILLSIAALGRTLRGMVAGGRRGALEKAAWTVALRTEAVMRRHCWTLRQVCVPECVAAQTLSSHGPGAH